MNGNWNIKGLIIEGISGTGKTTVLKELLRSNQYLNRKYLSSLVLSEHHTQRVLEKKDHEGTITPDDNINLLMSIVHILKVFSDGLNHRDWISQDYVEHRFIYILERFHFTHVYQYEHMNWELAKPIDNELHNLGAKLCILTVNDIQLRERLFRRKNPCWMKYLKKFGATEEEIVARFMRDQEKILEMSKDSALPTIIVDTSSIDNRSVTKQIMDFCGFL